MNNYTITHDQADRICDYIRLSIRGKAPALPGVWIANTKQRIIQLYIRGVISREMYLYTLAAKKYITPSKIIV